LSFGMTPWTDPILGILDWCQTGGYLGQDKEHDSPFLVDFML
jgi:hypothetical protein